MFRVDGRGAGEPGVSANGQSPVSPEAKEGPDLSLAGIPK